MTDPDRFIPAPALQTPCKGIATPLHAHLDLWPHPLTSAGRRADITWAVPDGASVADAIAACWLNADPGPDPAAAGMPDIAVALDGVVIPREAWGATPLEGGQHLTLRTVVRGGGDSDPLAIILTIAVLVVAPYLGGLVEGLPAIAALGAEAAAVAGALTAAAVTVAGGLIINALVTPRGPEGLDPQTAARPIFSLNGGANRARLYEPLLLVMGRHRVFPDLGAQPWTEFSGDDQYLNMILNFGLGDQGIDAADLMIGTTPLLDFEGATAAILRSEHCDWPANVDTIAGQLLEDTEWVQRTSSAGTYRLDIDIVATLYEVSTSTGAVSPLLRELHYDYRPHGTSDPWSARTVTLGGSATDDRPARDTIRQSLRIDLPGPDRQWDIRIRRGQDPVDETHIVDQINWTALRSYQRDTADYAGQTRACIRLPASAQASGQLPRIHADVAARIPASIDPAAAHTATRNPAWILLAFLRGGRIAGRLSWGLGLPDARIDFEALAAWAAWCDAHGPVLRCDLVLDRVLPVAEVIRTICQCGRATPSWASGKLGVIWEEAATPVTALVTPGNIVQASLRVTWGAEQPADEIAVRYLDPDADWQYQTIRRAMPGVVSPTRTATVTLSGVTSAAQAAMEANLQAARQLYHRRRLVWEMAAEGLSIARGDVVRLTHSLIDGGQTGRLADVITEATDGSAPQRWDTGTRLEMASRADQAARPHYMMLRLPDGTLHTSAVTAGAGALVVPETPLPEGWDDEGSRPGDVLWRFYGADDAPARGRIVAVEPVSDTRIRLEAIDEDSRYHAAAAADLATPLPLPVRQTPRVLHAALSQRPTPGGAVHMTLRLTVAGPWRGATVRILSDGLWRRVAEITDGSTVADWSADSARLSRIEITPGSRAAPLGPVYRLTRLAGGDQTDLPEISPTAGPPAPPVLAGVYVDATGASVTARLDLYHPAPAAVSAFDIRLEGPGGLRRTTRVAGADAARLTLDPKRIGSWLVVVRALGFGGAASEAVEAQFTLGRDLVEPDNVPEFRVRISGDLAYLTWGSAGPVTDHYHLRHLGAGLTGGWARAVDLETDVTGHSAIVPALAGQYLIRAVSSFGLPSPEASAVRPDAAALDDLNAVLTLTQQPAWAGLKSPGVQVVDGDLEMIPANAPAPPDDLPDGIASMGTYEFAAPADLGEVYTSRLTARLAGYGYQTDNTIAGWPPLARLGPLSGTAPEATDIILEMRTTGDDPAAPTAAWTDWRRFAIGDYTARGFEFRLVLRSHAAGVAVRVTELVVKIDMPDRVAGGRDIPCPPEGVTVTFEPPFKERPAILVTGQELPFGAVERRTGVTRAGFRTRFVDASGSGVHCSFNWGAVGYGRVQSGI